MSKGISGLFRGTSGEIVSDSCNIPINGIDYNLAGSSSVGNVYTVTIINNVHNVPEHGLPNSVTKNYRNGKLSSERYYGENGDAYLNIDYTDHGNPKMHPNVPHEHSIYFDTEGKMHRENEPDGGIRK